MFFLMTLLVLASASSRSAKLRDTPWSRKNNLDAIAQSSSYDMFLGPHNAEESSANTKRNPSSGWSKDTKDVCYRNEIIHECVVNYSWGLVGCF
jgi:hypothetical protein